MLTRARGMLAEDDKIEIPSDFEVDNTEFLWDRLRGWRPFLRRGRYTVAIMPHRSEIWLVEADWDTSGRVIFRGAKHKYIVRGRGISALMAKFRA